MALQRAEHRIDRWLAPPQHRLEGIAFEVARSESFIPDNSGETEAIKLRAPTR